MRIARAFNLTTFSLAELSHRELRSEVNGMDRNRWRIPSLSDSANFHGTRTSAFSLLIVKVAQFGRNDIPIDGFVDVKCTDNNIFLY